MIIELVGLPGSGKSFLLEKLYEKYGGRLYGKKVHYPLKDLYKKGYVIRNLIKFFYIIGYLIKYPRDAAYTLLVLLKSRLRLKDLVICFFNLIFIKNISKRYGKRDELVVLAEGYYHTLFYTMLRAGDRNAILPLFAYKVNTALVKVYVDEDIFNSYNTADRVYKDSRRIKNTRLPKLFSGYKSVDKLLDYVLRNSSVKNILYVNNDHDTDVNETVNEILIFIRDVIETNSKSI